MRKTITRIALSAAALAAPFAALTAATSTVAPTAAHADSPPPGGPLVFATNCIKAANDDYLEWNGVYDNVAATATACPVSGGVSDAFDWVNGVTGGEGTQGSSEVWNWPTSLSCHDSFGNHPEWNEISNQGGGWTSYDLWWDVPGGGNCNIDSPTDSYIIHCDSVHPDWYSIYSDDQHRWLVLQHDLGNGAYPLAPEAISTTDPASTHAAVGLFYSPNNGACN